MVKTTNLYTSMVKTNLAFHSFRQLGRLASCYATVRPDGEAQSYLLLAPGGRWLVVVMFTFAVHCRYGCPWSCGATESSIQGSNFVVGSLFFSCRLLFHDTAGLAFKPITHHISSFPWSDTYPLCLRILILIVYEQNTQTYLVRNSLRWFVRIPRNIKIRKIWSNFSTYSFKKKI